jgi:Uncharacterised nucleotidyltransferase
LTAFELLCHVVSPTFDPFDRALVACEAETWRAAMELATAHRVRPLLYQALKPGGAPADLVAELRRAALDNTQRNLRMLSQLLDVREALARANIAAIPFKGPALAALAFGDLWLREFSDLDLLIARADLPGADAVMSRLGYAPQLPLEAVTDAILNAYGVIAYAKPAGAAPVELHWELAPQSLPFPASFDQLAARVIEVETAGRRIPTMSPEDLLIYLCAHGAKHGWEYLGWVADVAWLVHRRGEWDWDAVVERARGWGCRRVLFVGLLLARDLLHAELAEPIEVRLRADATALRLAASVRANLAAGVEFGKLGQLLFYIRLRTGVGDRLHTLYHALAAPNVADWDSLRLPRPLHFLYPLVRIGRLLRRQS